AESAPLLGEPCDNLTGGAGTAVLFVVFEAEEAQLAHAPEDRLRHPTGGFPRLDVRRDFLVDEGPYGRAKHVVLLVEDLQSGLLAVLRLYNGRACPESVHAPRAGAGGGRRRLRAAHGLGAVRDRRESYL